MNDTTKLALGLTLAAALMAGGIELTQPSGSAPDAGAVDAGVSALCARKLPDSGCMRMLSPPPGDKPAPTDPGELNQFPAADAVGDCEIIECEIDAQ